MADHGGTLYTLGANLTRNNANDCIQISAPNIFLNMNGETITGPLPAAAGVGVHVLSTAPNAIIANGTIEEFATGFRSDAPNTLAASVQSGFNNTGIVFNGSGAEVVGIISAENLHNGVVLTAAASGSFLIVVESESNDANGIVLNGTTGVTLDDAVALQNVGYGVWLKGASFNSVQSGELEGNTIAGLYLGCHANGPSSSGCTIPPSNGNSISGVFSPGLIVGSCPNGSQHNQAIGVAIDEGNAKNHVLEVTTDANSSCIQPGDTTADGFDANPGASCAGNFWLGDSFTIAPNHTHTTTHPACMN